MAKGIAPAKLTGGGGFVFEDKVAAYFCSCILSDRPPFNPDLGTIKKIEFQTGPIGWFLDDVLLTLEKDNETYEFAISIKSNVQITKNKFPLDFVEATWKQFLHDGTKKFDQDKDKLAIIVAPPAPGLMDEIDDLLNKAHHQNPQNSVQRLEEPHANSETQRKLLRSFSCPPPLDSKYSVTDLQLGELLKTVYVFPFDFQSVVSNKLQKGIENCDSCLKSSSRELAESLWNTLVAISGDYRATGGYLDLPTLVDKLKNLFFLKSAPRFEKDWEKITNISRQERTVIPNKIGNKVVIERKLLLEELEGGFEAKNVQILIGASGSGKSVVAKAWADKIDQANPTLSSNSGIVLWLKASSLDVSEFYLFEQRLRLDNSIDELISTLTELKGYLIIDGLDRVGGDDAFQNLTYLTKLMKLTEPDSSWRLLLSCPIEDWERMRRHLIRFGILTNNWNTLSVKDLNPEELTPVWQAFPALERLKFQQHLRKLLLNPKVLDLLAINIQDTQVTENWTGESDLIEWFWRSEVTERPKGVMRSQFLMSLAQRQADNLQLETPLVEFSTGDLLPLDDLIKDFLCRHENG